MYVLLLENHIDDLIPKLLNNLHRPETADDLIAAIFRNIRNSLNSQFEKYIGNKENEINQLKVQLASERLAAFEEAQDYYRHNRFWRLISENGDVHIFTCGRDTPDNPNNQRGRGGRTNIDMWDYRAVFDLTHFFASNYPNTKVTIVDPISKFQSNEIGKTSSLAYRISNMERMLENKDCIIVGSPDVNDFAEVVLAKIHQIEPYTEGREKRKGFAIIKERQFTTSSFYWEKLGHEKEGVAQILNPGEYEYFPHETASEDGQAGKMFGILVVANNPFCDKGSPKKIIILSGFSGVATNAIAKILTNVYCLRQFFKLDQEYKNIDKNIEALIGVDYIVDRDFNNRDTRRIRDLSTAITFEKLVEI